jgi:hypothetical protein
LADNPAPRQASPNRFRKINHRFAKPPGALFLVVNPRCVPLFPNKRCVVISPNRIVIPAHDVAVCLSFVIRHSDFVILSHLFHKEESGLISVVMTKSHSFRHFNPEKLEPFLQNAPSELR